MHSFIVPIPRYRLVLVGNGPPEFLKCVIMVGAGLSVG
jgi:hypothetical protein